MKVKWNNADGTHWVVHDRKKISPDYPTISHCNAFLEGLKVGLGMAGGILRDEKKALEARADEIKDAFGQG